MYHGDLTHFASEFFFILFVLEWVIDLVCLCRTKANDEQNPSDWLLCNFQVQQKFFSSDRLSTSATRYNMNSISLKQLYLHIYYVY